MTKSVCFHYIISIQYNVKCLSRYFDLFQVMVINHIISCEVVNIP